MKLKYNSGTQYVPLDHIETVRYHIVILFTIFHCCASMLCFGDFNHIFSILFFLARSQPSPRRGMFLMGYHINQNIIEIFIFSTI